MTLSLRRHFADVLEWSPVAKGMLLLVVLLPLYGQYFGWSLYILSRDDATRLADTVYLSGQLPLLTAFMLIDLLLLAAGQWFRRHRPGSLPFQLLCAWYFALTLIYCGYIIGTLNFVAGVVLVGTPLAGFILLERWVVYATWLLALAAVVVLSYAGAAGLVSYAPGIVPPTPGDNANQLFWTTTTLFFAAPFIVFIIALVDFLLSRWREREMAFRTLSYTDPLTGVHNRRSILAQLEREVARRHRRGAPVSVVLLDLDHFKKINDTWGHPAGDEVLRQSARALGECLRQSDVLGRFGGEEFLLMLPDTDLAGAAVIAERCREQLAAVRLQADNGADFGITGSFGVASNARDPDMSVTMLIAAADGALYRAKQGGRNRVELQVD